MTTARILLPAFFCTAFLAFESLVGGDASARPHEEVTRYSLGFANATVSETGRVRLLWKVDGVDVQHNGRSLPPEGQDEMHSFSDPIPEKGTILWDTPDGKQHRQEVEVAKRVPDIQHFSGTLWFKITADGVVVVPLTKEETLRRVREHKPYP
jgi:hypothetical protein